MARNIGDVIARIVELLPINLDNRELRLRLEKIKSEAGFVAPELNTNWVKLCAVLDSSLPNPPETEWQREIMLIVQGKK